MSTTRSTYDKWNSEGWVWTIEADSDVGIVGAKDDVLIVFCVFRLFFSGRALFNMGGVNIAAFVLETLGFIVLIVTFILQHRGYAQLQSILAVENSTCTPDTCIDNDAESVGSWPGYGWAVHYVTEWKVTLGMACLFTWSALAWRLSRPGRSLWLLFASAVLLSVPVVGFAMASREWEASSFWQRWVVVCQVLVRDSSSLLVDPISSSPGMAAALLLWRFVASSVLIAVAVSVFFKEGLLELSPRNLLERFINDVPPKGPGTQQQPEREELSDERETPPGRKLPTAKQRSLMLQLIRPVFSVPRKHLRLLSGHEKFKTLNIPAPDFVQVGLPFVCCLRALITDLLTLISIFYLF